MAACAVVAVWLSTVVGYSGSDDVRKYIVLLMITACFAMTYCSVGRPKCFWFAFSVFFFLVIFSQGLAYPTMYWLGPALRPFITSVDIYGDMQTSGPSMRIVEFFADTARLAIDLALATLAGFIGRYIYDCKASLE